MMLFATVKHIEATYRALARQRHPGRPGGSRDMMSELNLAREARLKEMGRGDAA